MRCRKNYLHRNIADNLRVINHILQDKKKDLEYFYKRLKYIFNGVPQQTTNWSLFVSLIYLEIHSYTFYINIEMI